MLVDFSKLEVADLLRSGVILVGFVLAFLGDKKGETRVWLLADTVFLCLSGLGAYFFPSLLLSYGMVGKVDYIHMYLLQGFGIMLVILGVFSFCQYHTNSRDPQVTGGWLLSRVVGLSFLIVNAAYGKMSMATDSVRLADQAVAFHGLGFGLLWIGSVIKLWQHYSSENEGDRSTSRGKSDSVMNQPLLGAILIMLPGFILFFGMPSLAMEVFVDSKYDSFHLHMIRVNGAAGLMSIVQEMTALQYHNDEDKRGFFIGHIVGLVFVYPYWILNQLKHALYINSVFYSSVGFSLLHLGNSVYAAFILRKDKQY